MIELKVENRKVTVIRKSGTVGETINDVADIIRHLYLSLAKWDLGDTFRRCLLDYLVNEGGDAEADKAWAWKPPKEEP